MAATIKTLGYPSSGLLSSWVQELDPQPRTRVVGPSRELTPDEAADFWRSVTTAAPLAGTETLWRAQVAPSRAAALAQSVADEDGRCLIDWAGAALWIGAPAACDVRSAALAAQGHAMLVRAPGELRTRIPARKAGSPALGALEARLRQAFDPAGILDPHRFS